MYVWINDRYNFFCQPVDYSTRENAMRVRSNSKNILEKELLNILRQQVHVGGIIL